MCPIPMKLAFLEPGGPFEGAEVSLRAKYGEDVPHTLAIWSMGRLLGEAIGKKSCLDDLPSLDDWGLGWREELVLERKVPVYVE